MPNNICWHFYNNKSPHPLCSIYKSEWNPETILVEPNVFKKWSLKKMQKANWFTLKSTNGLSAFGWWSEHVSEVLLRCRPGQTGNTFSTPHCPGTQIDQHSRHPNFFSGEKSFLVKNKVTKGVLSVCVERCKDGWARLQKLSWALAPYRQKYLLWFERVVDWFCCLCV